MFAAMKARCCQSHPVSILASRWLAYASASAATAFVGASPAGADVHYSGRVDVVFPPDQNKSVALQLETPGNSIFFAHAINGGTADFFGAAGLDSGAFAGSYPGFEYAFVWRLKTRDRYVSRAHFTTVGLASGRLGPWCAGIEAAKIGGGPGEALTLWVFVLTMAPAFNIAGPAFAWMVPLQDSASPFWTTRGQTQESPSGPARQALLDDPPAGRFARRAGSRSGWPRALATAAHAQCGVRDTRSRLDNAAR